MILLVGGTPDDVTRVKSFFDKFGYADFSVIGQHRQDQSIRAYPAIKVEKIEELVESLTDAAGELILTAFKDEEYSFGDTRYMISLRSK